MNENQKESLRQNTIRYVKEKKVIYLIIILMLFILTSVFEILGLHIQALITFLFIIFVYALKEY
jgi:hypothetical protein